LKEEALDHAVYTTRFGAIYGPVGREGAWWIETTTNMFLGLIFGTTTLTYFPWSICWWFSFRLMEIVLIPCKVNTLLCRKLSLIVSGRKELEFQAKYCTLPWFLWFDYSL